jgi:UDP-N-acetylglucosamine 4-epimerase
MSIPPSTSSGSKYEQLRLTLSAQPKTWLVTGVAGFIGSSLLAELLSMGQTVVGLDNFATGFQANIDDVLGALPHHANRFRLITGDIRDAKTCRAACEGVDYVLHQAALGSVPRSLDDPATSNAVNVDGTLNMFVAARDAGVRRTVYASSCAIYGDSAELPLNETRPFLPLSPYAATKAADEMYAAAFARSFGAEIVGLRYFNVFGRRQDPNGAYAAVIPRWITSLVKGEPCRVFGDGSSSRDFVHVSNVAQANILAATSSDKRSVGAVFNVATGTTTSLNELFREIRDVLAGINPSVADAEPVYDAPRPGDIAHSSASIDRIRDVLGYEPGLRLTDGLSEALDWYTRYSGAASA